MIIIIILLILCLPLILMLTLYSATTAISVAVAVPVSGIDVLEEDIVELDLDKGETYTVEYIISPTEAKNKKVKYIFEQIGKEKLAEFTVDGDTIKPTSAGQAKVIVETDDGAYRDYFNVVVYSRQVNGITSKVANNVIHVNETTKIETKFSPVIASNKGLTYKVVEGQDVVTVNNIGEIRGIGIGEAKVEITSVNNPNAKAYVEIRVEPTGAMDILKPKQSITVFQDPKGEFGIYLNPYVTFVGDPVIEVVDTTHGNPVEDSLIVWQYDKASNTIKYEIKDRSYIGTLQFNVTVTPEDASSITKSCSITQISNITADWKEYNEWYPVAGSGLDIEIDLNPLGADVTFTAMFEFVASTSQAGTINSGELVTLTSGEVYTVNGGYYSVMILNSTDGAFLHIVRTVTPQSDMEDTDINIKLFITDNNDSDNTIELDEIGVYVS